MSYINLNLTRELNKLLSRTKLEDKERVAKEFDKIINRKPIICEFKYRHPN